MARRSSARIRAKVSSTPQPQKVSDMGVDGMSKTPRTAPKLSSLREDEETPSKPAETPRDGTPIKPSPEEMHPQNYQMSTAKPLDEARWLGFSSTKATQQTPTKTPAQKVHNVLDKAPNFDFTFSRPVQQIQMQMSPEARALMEEKREEAAKIRQQMEATQHGQTSASDVLGRKMAMPKAKVNRFSDVHMEAFKKMDSIANHPSAYRLEKNKQVAAADKNKPLPPLEKNKTSLKRSPSKAELEQSSTSTSLPRPTSRGNLEAPAKRVKRDNDDDTATTRPATPKDTKIIGRTIKPPPSLQKSARRTTMIGSSLPRSPVKMGMTSASLQQPAPAPAPLLSKSPIKSPVKVALKVMEEEAEAPESPLLSRSPVKSQGPIKPVDGDMAESPAASTKIPYLSRSPSKKSVADFVADFNATDDKEKSTHKPNKGPLLSRSPSKISMPVAEKLNNAGEKTPSKPSLLTRFNLLRASPVKSILRTPQRLYSDDPFQVAKGTHLSTPPNAISNMDKPHPQRPPKTAPVMKHVDFSASTKGLDQFDTIPDTPTKAPTPPPKDTLVDAPSITYPALPSVDAPSAKKAHRRMTMAVPSDFTFRAGAAISFAPSPRRITSNDVKPSIRHVSAEPDMQSAAGKKRKISDVAENAPLSAPKGSSDKENDEEDSRPAKKARSVAPEKHHARPSAAPAKTPTRKVPTIGVKPKAASTSKPKEKRPGMLSAARLAMLATPKRR